MKHAQEPWQLTHDDGGRDHPALRDKDGHIVADIHGAENARRILACVNACKIVTTEELERYYNTGAGIDEALEEASLKDHLKAVQQRNHLQATIGQIADELALEDHERGGGQILSALMRLKSGKTSVVVPEALKLDVFSNSHDEGYVNGWNACRAELLAAALPGNGPLTGEGSKQQSADDLELALFAENQKRQEVEQQRDQLRASLDKIVDKSVELEQQRDLLLSALEQITDPRVLPSKGDPVVLREHARSVIAAVKGGAK